MYFVICNLFIMYLLYKIYYVFLRGDKPNKIMLKNKPNHLTLDKYENIDISYYYESKNSDKLIICVPGFGGSTESYSYYFNKFNDFNFLTLDFFGRGWSSSVNKKNNLSLFSRQLNFVVNKITQEKPISSINFIGTSMGCMIIDHYIKQFVSNESKINLNKIIFIAPAGKMVSESIFSILAKKPIIGELIVSVMGEKLLDNFHKKCYNIDMPSYNYRYFLENHHGYLKSLLSTIRHINFTNYNYSVYNKNDLLIINSSADRITKFKFNNFKDNKIHNFEDLGHSELIKPSLNLIKKFILN